MLYYNCNIQTFTSLWIEIVLYYFLRRDYSIKSSLFLYLNNFFINLNISNVVRVYTLLYAYFLGFLTQPYPRGILAPVRWITCLLMLVRALIRFFMLGLRRPIFISFYINPLTYFVIPVVTFCICFCFIIKRIFIFYPSIFL